MQLCHLSLVVFHLLLVQNYAATLIKRPAAAIDSPIRDQGHKLLYLVLLQKCSY